jgi:hypothetical protein
VIESVAIALVALGALIYVAGPLRSGPRRDPAGRSALAEDAGERKRAAFGALLDIEKRSAPSTSWRRCRH